MADDNQAQEQHKTAREVAFELVPDVRESDLIRQSDRMGIESDEDSCWGMVECYALCQAAARESAAAAKSVSENVDQLQQSLAQVPTDASKAVLNAGKAAAGEVESSIRGATDEQIERINNSVAATVQKKIKLGGDHLIKQIDNAFAKGQTEIDQYKKDKVHEFRAELHEAADQAAAAELIKARRRSFTAGVVAVLFGVAITIGGSNLWEQYGPGWFQTDQVFHHCSHGTHGHIWCRLPIQHHH